MYAVRIIPKLEIKGPNLVKGIQLEGLRVLGIPEEFARYYSQHGADELIYIDVVASLYGRNSILDVIRNTSREIFIPLTVGGGLRTIEDIRLVLQAGADKVAINTAAIHHPQIISQASKIFGASTIVLSIAAKKQPDGDYLAYTDNGREKTPIRVVQWAQQGEELGAGEILLTSIDRDGTGSGFDVELVRQIAEGVSIPVIACGGAGTIEDVAQVISYGKADAVALASMLHYNYILHHTMDHGSFAEGNTEFLRHVKKFTRVMGVKIEDIKQHLIESGIHCRMEQVRE